MYDTEYICSYNLQDVFLETDRVTDLDKDFIRNVLYRNDILYIFSLEEYNEAILSELMYTLYNKIKDSTDLLSIMMKLSQQYNSEPLFGLTILFSFDYLYLTHNCISQYLNCGTILEKDLLELKNKIV